MLLFPVQWFIRLIILIKEGKRLTFSKYEQIKLNLLSFHKTG